MPTDLYHILCDINPLALYVPCAAHSLNLIGVCAVESCVEATNFFSLVQKLFTFFSASTTEQMGDTCTIS